MTEAHFLSGAFLCYLVSLVPHAFVFFKKSSPKMERLARLLVVLGFPLESNGPCAHDEHV